jgi:hypothetical protein
MLRYCTLCCYIVIPPLGAGYDFCCLSFLGLHPVSYQSVIFFGVYVTWLVVGLDIREETNWNA